ncbi:MAG: NF038122 family metalloprotease [Hyphomicrobiales bacterium]|nr:NF038122 family metalloprotease [Hyphomicrobiales bacterium]
MIINASYDSTLSSAPSGFQTAVAAAIAFFQQTFATNITVNITFSWGSAGGGIASSSTYGTNVAYSSVVTQLASKAAGVGDLASEVLPAANPFASLNGGRIWGSTADLKALGLLSYTGTDGVCTLGSSYAWNFNPSIASVSGEFNAVSALEHEISEVLGRQCGSDGSLNPTPLALFRYASSGVIDTSSSYSGAYFSLDGGKTNLAQMGEQGADLADWGASVSGDSFGYASTGLVDPVTSADIKALQAIGYTLFNPTVSGQVANLGMVDKQTIKPFVAFAVTNPNNASSLSVKLTLSNASYGALSNLSGGAYNAATGTYTVSGSASVVAAAVAALVYTPTIAPGVTQTTSFSITVDDHVSPPISQSAGSVVTTSTLGGGQTVTMSAANGNAASLYNTGTAPDNVSGANGVVYLTSAQAIVNGAGNTIYFSGGAGNAVGVTGAASSSDAIYGSNGSVIVQGGCSAVLVGDNDILTAGANAVVSVTGAGDTVTFRGTLTIGGNGATGVSNIVGADGATVNLTSNSRMDFSGSNTAIASAGGSSYGIVGSNDALTAGAGDSIWLSGNGATGASNIVSASSAHLHLLSNARMDLSGSNDTITSSGGSSYGIVGSNDTITGGIGDSIWLGGNGATGASNHINASGVNLYLLATARMDLTGSNDTITSSGGSSYGIVGANETITAGAGDSIWLANNGATSSTNAVSASSAHVYLLSNSRMDLAGSNDVIVSSGGSAYGVSGSNDSITAGVGDAIWLSGTATNILVTGAVGALAINQFAADVNGVVDLLNNVGGYASASAAAAALVNDGHGGALLSLGASGSIDFAGVAPASLGAANFKIG